MRKNFFRRRVSSFSGFSRKSEPDNCPLSVRVSKIVRRRKFCNIALHAFFFNIAIVHQWLQIRSPHAAMYLTHKQHHTNAETWRVSCTDTAFHIRCNGSLRWASLQWRCVYNFAGGTRIVTFILGDLINRAGIASCHSNGAERKYLIKYESRSALRFSVTAIVFLESIPLILQEYSNWICHVWTCGRVIVILQEPIRQCQRFGVGLLRFSTYISLRCYIETTAFNAPATST